MSLPRNGNNHQQQQTTQSKITGFLHHKLKIIKFKTLQTFHVTNLTILAEEHLLLGRLLGAVAGAGRYLELRGTPPSHRRRPTEVREGRRLRGPRNLYIEVQAAVVDF